MPNKLKVLLTMLGADSYIADRDYEPVTGRLTAFNGVKHVEDFDFECDIKDYADVVTKYYYDCESRGLKASFAYARKAII